MLRTPAGTARLDILEWLKDPVAHFPKQRHADPAEDGVTASAVAAKLGVPRKVAETHLGLLVNIGLLRTKLRMVAPNAEDSPKRMGLYVVFLLSVSYRLEVVRPAR